METQETSSIRPTGHEPHPVLDRLQHAIEHAAHMLPAQGPITVFIHHNTLHAFEDLPFEEAVRRGAAVFHCQPYLDKARYRQALRSGRIHSADLRAVLEADLGDDGEDPIFHLGTRLDLRLAMLEFPLRAAPAAELRWFVAETDALARYRRDVPAGVAERFVNETRRWVLRDLLDKGDSSKEDQNASSDRRARGAISDLLAHFGQGSIERWSDEIWEAFSLHALWRICRHGMHGVKPPSAPHPAVVRHRNLLLEASGQDTDDLVHDVLIRFCAAFLDQGFSPWPLPGREHGFYRSFLALYDRPGGPPDAWLRGLRTELRRLSDEGTTPLECLWESLDLLGVTEQEWDDYLTATLLALGGWAGMICQMEQRADRVVHPAPPGSLVEFLAVRLLLERLALAHVAKEELAYQGPLKGLRRAARSHHARHEPTSVDQLAFQVFQLAQVLGWSPAELHRLTKPQWTTLVAEILAFPSLERRRIWHLAFERRYRVQTLDAIAVSSRQDPARPKNVQFQAVFCLDEREESFRRHLEEQTPGAETFSAAGFYNIAMYYRGAGDAHFVPLCPVVVRPQHWVAERVQETLEEVHRRRAKTRRALATASHQLHVGSRTFAAGAFVSAGLGVLASAPLVARVVFPRWTSRLRQTASRLVRPPQATRLKLQRESATPGPEEAGLGLSLDEMTDIVERLLREIGLIEGFAPIVIITGHGSNSLNNPHNSAYNCGACGGGAGGPNARAFAQMANDPSVRSRLAEHGLHVPDSTVFVGAFHNTCNDSVTFYDVDGLSPDLRTKFEKVREIIEEACDRNAHERCRRFESAPLTLSFPAARRHVEARSEDLAQTRPECGHATNAVCFVGRRSRTLGLFMDRRTFLTSYDPTQDDAEHAILTRILQAAVPVCAGINLEYYFSYVDPTGWGCGTKLPHNVASLLGVMDGAASDLRTGLPWQMVEIHEPVRLLFVVETQPETMLKIMDRHESIGRLVRNQWIQMATLSPGSSEIHLFSDGKFQPYRPEVTELPRAASSFDWYCGQRGHLHYALIDSPTVESRATSSGKVI